ncbi:MAG: SdpI family protein [Proteobacteria bacterium]|nr:SdpI family protein [Pseudomonadota bacterium]
MTLNRIFYGALLSALAMGAFSLYAWFQLPGDALVAIHWNIEGAIDNYASKTWGLAAIPLFTLAFAGLLKALPYLEPRRKHFEKSPKLIGATWIGVLLVLWVAEITIAGTAMGWAINIFFLLKIAFGAMMMLIGNYAAKSQSMFMVGFRTPWTLSSETVWVKTHRLFGKMFLIAGLVMVLLPMSWFSTETFAAIFMALIMVPVVVSLIYSWVVWRQEQQDLNE